MELICLDPGPDLYEVQLGTLSSEGRSLSISIVTACCRPGGQSWAEGENVLVEDSCYIEKRIFLCNC